MDRRLAWNKIRESIPGTFYNIVKASKLEKEIRLSKPIHKNQTNFTPFTELERYHRELEHLDELLEKEREFNKVKEVEFSKRWDLAFERNKDLEEVLKKFTEYHDECQDKIEKDNIRREICLDEITEKDQEIQKLRKQLKVFNGLKSETEKRRNLCEIYKDYMKEVVQASGEEYSNIQDLISRFEDLKRIRDEKSSAVVDNLEKSVFTQELINREYETFQGEEMAYRTHHSQLEKYEEKLGEYTGSLNEKVIQTKTNAQKNILTVERSKVALYSLYLNFCEQMDQPVKLKETDIKGQLAFIQQFLGEMRKITTRVRECLKGDSDMVLFPNTLKPTRNHPGGSGRSYTSSSMKKSALTTENNVLANMTLDLESGLVKRKVRPISERSGSSPNYNA